MSQNFKMAAKNVKFVGIYFEKLRGHSIRRESSSKAPGLRIAYRPILYIL